MAPTTQSSCSRALPRTSLALASAVHAGAFSWAAATLPSRAGTSFTLATSTLAALHLLNAGMAMSRSGGLARVWRLTGWASLGYLLWLGWSAADAAVAVAALYGELGRGVAAAIGALGSCVVLFTFPFACWSLSRTGGIGFPGRIALLAGAVLLTALLCRSAAQAHALPVGFPAEEAEAELARGLAPPSISRANPESLFQPHPVSCRLPPGGDVATAFVTWRTGTREGTGPRSRCIQAEADALAAQVLAVVTGARGPVKLDWVTGVSALHSRNAPLDALALRPGLDGVCRDATCFAPWQLVVSERFTTHTPLPFVPDLRFGFSPRALRAALGGGSSRSDLDGLVRIETRSLLLTEGRALLLRRMHERPPPVDAGSLDTARAAAERYVTGAMLDSGRFRYLLQPFRGARDEHSFDLARQAGTTRVLCELARNSTAAADTARRSLAAMADLETRSGGMTLLRVDPSAKHFGLGSVALPLLAFLGCRERVGNGHDPLIGRLAYSLLALQRADGGFHRGWSLETGAPLSGPEPLFAAGQAVFAASELEALAIRLEAEGASPLPEAERLALATERAMQHTATDYWDHALAGYFFLEENWHCLAARASLSHHRHDGYERFCLDYVAFKSRLVLDATPAGDEDFAGGYGFGNVLPPHNTSSAGFAEALAAAVAVKRARGLEVEDDRLLLARVLRFLIRQQWTARSCFACAPGREALGGFSESMASPAIRIDYVQHAWAALGHGGDVVLAGSAPAGAP